MSRFKTIMALIIALFAIPLMLIFGGLFDRIADGTINRHLIEAENKQLTR